MRSGWLAQTAFLFHRDVACYTRFPRRALVFPHIGVSLMFRLYFPERFDAATILAIVAPEKMNLAFVFRSIYTSSTRALRVLSPSRCSKIPRQENNQHNLSGHH